MWKLMDSFFDRTHGHKRGHELSPPEVPSRPGKDSSTVRRIVIIALIADGRDRALLADVCARNQWSVHFTDTCVEAWAILNRLKAPVVLYDRDLPGTEWRDVIQMMASSGHNVCAILLSRVADDYLWNEVIGKGGYDICAKPLREEDVVRSVRLAWSYCNSSASLPPLPNKHYR